jgi:DNA repair protein RecN (Recombination protein N)
MLSSLHIENIAVIKHADIDLESGFQVLTGETGAGKSILIDCINLLLGARPSKDLIRNGETKATVSGLFTDISAPLSRLPSDIDVCADEDGCILLTRTFDVDGKAQTKLNGRTIPASLQREIMPYLINIHGQNDNRILMSLSAQLSYLDGYAENGELMNEYSSAYEALEGCRKRMLSLKKQFGEILINGRTL